MLVLCAFASAAPPTTKQAQDAARNHQLPQLASQVEPRLREMLGDLDHVNRDELVHVAALREFGRYFARVDAVSDGQMDTLAWLATQPKLMETLMLETCSADPPDRVAEVLRSLREDHRAKMEEFAELTTAICVVWDAPERFGPDEDAKIESEQVSRLFAHFADAKSRVASDVKKTPVELLVYVVDLELTDQEVSWAAERFGRQPNVPALARSVPYHEGVGYDKSKDVLDEHSYVLPNVLRGGGTCEDSARFAAQIGKSCGIPATVVKAADVTDGPATAWVGFVGSTHARWDFVSGKLSEHATFAGELIDPQSYSPISEGEAALSAAASPIALRDRLASLALSKSADLASAADSPALFERAIDWSPCNRSAWFALAQLASNRKLSDEQIRVVDRLMTKHLGRSDPQFAVLLRLRMLEGRGLIEFEDGIRHLRADYGDRPEALAAMLLALADRERSDGRAGPAVETLLELLRAQSRNGAIALAAMGRLEQLLRKSDELARLSEVYRDVFASLAKPPATRWGRTTPYYRIGEKYAIVLDELKGTDAAIVRGKISSIVVSE
jgi:hypothetical protein